MNQRIADYALLSDCQSAALVGRDGSIDWWCAPRFDSRSVFARLLDPAGGHWSVRPVAPCDVERAYLAGTMVLRTTFRTAAGTLAVTDALALSPESRGHGLGLKVPHAVVRLVEAVAGEVDVEVDFAPRPEYGLVTPRLVPTAAGLRTVGGPDTLLLGGDRPLEVDGGRARGRFVLRAGDSAAFALHHSQGLHGSHGLHLDARRALAGTAEAWRSWSRLHQGYRGAYREEVARSALVLQALTYQPSGAVVAAPTTSLPEVLGGTSNWDYRFAWLRDASFTLNALWVAACPDEASRYFAWMARAAGTGPDGSAQIVVGVEGERDLTEHTLDHLGGFRGSAPVRVGNDAWKQKQLDVPGEVLHAAWLLRDHLGELDPATAAFLCGLADRAATAWEEPDAGIWEGREGERHYLTSKVMCWAALDRAVALASRLGPSARPKRWAAAADEVRRAVLERGWNRDVGAFTGAFGSDHLDASVLLLPLVGFLPATDRRMLATIDAVESRLSHEGLVVRWTGAEDGAFVACSYWLADCLARAGQPGRARAVFERVTACANDVGLLSEEVDPSGAELVGNFPLALSHAGLVNAAWSIERATAATPTTEPSPTSERRE